MKDISWELAFDTQQGIEILQEGLNEQERIKEDRYNINRINIDRYGKYKYDKNRNKIREDD